MSVPDLDLVFKILEHNAADVLAIEAKIGGAKGVIDMLPHLKAIYATVKAEQPGGAPNG